MQRLSKMQMKFKGNRLVLVRKELSVLRRTTLVTFFSICPKEIIKSFNQTSLEVTFINDSKLLFLDANIAKDPMLQKIKGLEIGWFGIDEANEVSVEVYNMLKTRLRWVLPNKQKPRYEGRLTSNPEPCWLISTFIQSTNPDEVYIQSLTTDNYDENSEYVITLKEAFKDNPKFLRKYLYADWSALDMINQLISSEVIISSAERIENSLEVTSMGIDVARYGDDKTVFTILKNGNIELIESYEQTSITEIVTRSIQLIQEAFLPFNLRSQMYYELRRDMMNGQIGNLTDETLKLELQSIQYEIYSDKKVKVISKEAIKKLLGRSPDYADSLVYANWVKTYRGGIKWYMPISGGL